MDTPADANRVRVMVVDDHPMWCDAVARDLAEAGMDVVATAGRGDKAIRVAPAAQPTVAVVDLQLPDISGVEVTQRLVAMAEPPRVLVLSASGEQPDVLDAVKAGATGYVVKSASREELIAAVGSVHEGEAVFTPGLAGLVLGEYRRMASGPQSAATGENERGDTPYLTPRETEILRLVAKGLSYKRIAERLTVSHRTVQNHVQNTLSKLQLHNRVELARYAIDQGLDE
ncbi:LuxR family two component transcriptional regulator [Haloactinospora alba]|uniref:LuxR family two component transcriptional regulator n=1 Tax=Haloactinospora alba TaxID=405555 RepID=A0A543NHK4_9ACTN|nr:response regulator transcription factor [Haloactinospora alba]TQN31327.1 LuxR family two component transcriptional regulator [Haloactinospora alba]